MKIKSNPLLRRAYHLARGFLNDAESEYQQQQKVLINQYQAQRRAGVLPYDTIAEAGFRCYSQFDEDGIILYVLSMIGFQSRSVVEICCGTGDECNATNLILNHGFQGFLFDGDPTKLKIAKDFFRAKKDCLLTPPAIQQAWITRDNINALLVDIGVSGEVDLLSLDIDGNDYYVWEAIDAISPRLCVFETQNIIPGDRSLTIRYDPEFDCFSKQGPAQDYRGVSLAAMKKLSARKGYRFIGCHKHGFNAFFLRNDVAPGLFPEASIQQAHDNRWTREGQAKRWPLVQDMDWVEV